MCACVSVCTYYGHNDDTPLTGGARIEATTVPCVFTRVSVHTYPITTVYIYIGIYHTGIYLVWVVLWVDHMTVCAGSILFKSFHLDASGFGDLGYKNPSLNDFYIITVSIMIS
jgi:hypothetical protein